MCSALEPRDPGRWAAQSIARALGHRLDRSPDQLRQLVDFVCEHSETDVAAELARTLVLPRDFASDQFHRLVVTLESRPDTKTAYHISRVLSGLPHVDPGQISALVDLQRRHPDSEAAFGALPTLAARSDLPGDSLRALLVMLASSPDRYVTKSAAKLLQCDDSLGDGQFEAILDFLRSAAVESTLIEAVRGTAFRMVTTREHMLELLPLLQQPGESDPSPLWVCGVAKASLLREEHFGDLTDTLVEWISARIGASRSLFDAERAWLTRNVASLSDEQFGAIATALIPDAGSTRLEWKIAPVIRAIIASRDLCGARRISILEAMSANEWRDWPSHHREHLNAAVIESADGRYDDTQLLAAWVLDRSKDEFAREVGEALCRVHGVRDVVRLKAGE